MIIIDKGTQYGTDEAGNKYEKEIEIPLESTMIYMGDILTKLHEVLEMGLEMGDKDLMSEAITTLSWITSDIRWHDDGEYGDNENQYWDAGIERMDHHGLMAEAILLEKEAGERYDKWREAGGDPQYRVTNISMR